MRYVNNTRIDSPGPRGFSLIELMIAVAIVGILAAIAYPSYLAELRKSRRVEAKSLILQAADRQEQLYGVDNAYRHSMSALGLPDQSENGDYRLQVETADTAPQRYTIWAYAQGDQTKDACAVLSVDERGDKHAWSTARPPAPANVSTRCW